MADIRFNTPSSPDAVQALRDAADNMLLGKEGQPFHGAAVWLHRRADALADYATPTPVASATDTTGAGA